jgi:hypothetical protein
VTNYESLSRFLFGAGYSLGYTVYKRGLLSQGILLSLIGSIQIGLMLTRKCGFLVAGCIIRVFVCDCVSAA